MKHVVVAVAQQALRVYPDLDAYRHGIERFFRLAESKHARLLIFPEHTALMVIPPLVEGFRARLLKRAEAPSRGAPSWWERARNRLMRNTARLLGGNLTEGIRQVLEEVPDIVWQHYVDTFASLAYEYKMTVIAGSGYFLDPNDRVRRHVATVFGPDGDILGQQAKMVLNEAEKAWAEPGRGWHVIATPVGRLGILFDEEVMYPEIGRWLAYQGAEAIVVLAATADTAVGTLLRDGTLARVTDNQIFGALAFTVGQDLLVAENPPTYRGRSALFAPHGLTPRHNGVLVEAGTATAEVLLTSRWDFEALRRYWETAPLPLRRRMPAMHVGRGLAAFYERGVTLDEAVQALPERKPRALPESAAVPEAAPEEEAPVSDEVKAAAVPSAEEGRGEKAPEAEPPAAEAPGETEVPEATGSSPEEPPAEALPEEGERAEPPTPPEPAETAVSGAGERPEPVPSPEPEVAAPEPEPESRAAPTPEAPTEPEPTAAPGPESPSPEPKREPATESEPAPPPEAPATADLPPVPEEATPATAPAETTTEEAPLTPGAPEPAPSAPEGEEAKEDENETEGETPEEPSLHAVARMRAEETPTQEDEGEAPLPESLWASVKAELHRAAAVLRSLSEPESPASQEPTPPEQTGWFHRRLQAARPRKPDQPWEEY